MQEQQQQQLPQGRQQEEEGAAGNGFTWSTYYNRGDSIKRQINNFSPFKSPPAFYDTDNSWYVMNNNNGNEYPYLFHHHKSQTTTCLQNYDDESHDVTPINHGLNDQKARFVGSIDSSSSATARSPPVLPPKPFDDDKLDLLCNSGFVHQPDNLTGFSSQMMRLVHSDFSFQVPFRNNIGLMLEDQEGSLKNINTNTRDGGVHEMSYDMINDSDSEEPTDNYVSGLEISNTTSSSMVDGDRDKKGKKAKLPAKNLMAERRRRKKLNDRLYLLRSVVPKISKMDRASIVADAIDYLKELLQRIKQLNDELQILASAPPTPQHASSLLALTSVVPSGPLHVKEEECRTNSPSPNNQPPSVHVELREENAFNIHMFSTRRPGLLLSTMKALDSLGLEVHQAVISCFNGFALDVFRAEKFNEGLEVGCDQIKAALLDIAAFHGLM